MFKKSGLIILSIVVAATAVGAWQLPNILRAIPSRYVARMPEPIQQIGVREHVAVLPTAAAPVNLAAILPTPTATATTAPPSTPTPIPTAAATGAPPTATPPPTATQTPTATPIPIPESGRLTGIEHQFQQWNNCGPATLAMALSYYNLNLYQSQTAAWLKPDPEDRNVTPEEMAAYVNEETDYAALSRANGDLDDLRRFLSEGMPVIIETGVDPPGQYRWMDWYGHYYLVVAYDDAQQQVWVYDSWLGTDEEIGVSNSEGRIISYDRFDQYWRQFNRNYIVLHRPEQADRVAEIVGPQMDDDVMWQRSLERTMRELEQEPENAYLWFNAGTAHNGLGQYEQAATFFDQARALSLPWRMLWYQFGPYEAYYEIGRYQDVIDLADVTLNHRPYFEESFYYRGLAHAAVGDTAAARRDLRDAVEFNPRFQPAARALEQLQ